MNLLDPLRDIALAIAATGFAGLVAALVIRRLAGRWTWCLPPLAIALIPAWQWGLDYAGPRWLLLPPLACIACGWALIQAERHDLSRGGRAARSAREGVGVRTAVRRSRARRRGAADDHAYVIGADRRRFPVRIAFGRTSGGHQLLLGATGSGKTTTMLAGARHHVRAGFACIAVDLKGDPGFPESLEKLARSEGRPFHCFSLDGGAHWNPVAHGGRSELKDKLMGSEEFSERHYEAMYERYLQQVFSLVEEGIIARRLDAAVELLDPNELERRLGKFPNDGTRKAVRRYLDNFGPEQKRHLHGLHDRMAIVLESSAGRWLLPAPEGKPEIDLRRAITGQEVVCFSLNSSLYPGTAKLVANLIAQDLQAVSGSLQATGERRPALVCIDEFSALDAGNVIALFQRGRSATISLMLATQELADLRRVADGFSDQVLGNVEVVVAGRQNVPASAELIAGLCGTRETWIHTFQTERPKGLVPWSPEDSGRGTKRRGEEFIVHPNEIKALGVGEAVVVTKNPHAARVVRVAP